MPLIVLFLLIFWGCIDKTYATEFCQSAAAKVISAQGIIELRRAHETTWQQTAMHTAICPGDTVRARSHSRAALLLSNASVLRLDQKTSITFPKSEDNEAASLLDLFSGAIHIITRTPKPFKVRTPFVNAGVDGTEFFVGVDENSTKLVIYEGRVTASNEQGNLTLSDHEAAITIRNAAPQKVGSINPTDSVQWALYYPIIINYQLDGLTTQTVQPELKQSIEFYRQGNVFEALSLLDAISAHDYSVNLLLYRAGLLLAVGQASEAKTSIAEALTIQQENSNAYALLAMIAIVQNDKEHALELATRAITLDTSSPSAKLALSYVQQAHFKIEEALASVQEAVAIDPRNALVWARLAKLQMSVGDLDRALEAAHQAVALNPDLARTKTVLGFAHLLQIHTQQAKIMFSEAITLDQADPMPRLGMGLTLIREGKLEAGRIELEIAVSLDPASSLIRSYLGKAYFEEKRYPLAGTQFDLAKEKDPNDPTPWFYDAIQKQTQNRPIEALKDLQKSIELNNNRAVYRSKFLLDQDEAARGSSLARIYDNLGFEKRALVETAKSLSIDPANHSAHRFLSDAYANIPRHEVARVSELLQAQLLQPVNVNPVQPHLAVADLNIITGTGPARTGFNEFAPLMERNRPQLVASGIAGSNSTFGNEATLSAVYDRASVSVGQYHFQSDGFRPNNDQKHNIYNAFVQFAVTPKLNMQAEIRRRNTEQGDLLLDFDMKIHTQDRRSLEQDSARVGARYSLSPKQDFLVSSIYIDRREGQAMPAQFYPLLDTTFPAFNVNQKDQGYQIEGQYLFKDKYINLITGGGTYQIDAKQRCNGEVCSSVIPFKRERENAYVYSNMNYYGKINTTFGLSYDAFKDGIDYRFDAFNPKFGLQWNITDALRLRLAWFETVKSALIANQTLEPTQVAGFNQMFDDPNGTRSRRMGVGLDSSFSKNIYGGIEASDRDLKVSFVNSDMRILANEQQQERLYRSYLYWLPHARWAVNGEFQLEQFSRAAIEIGGSEKPYQIHTLSAPLTINYFHPDGIFSRFSTTFVQQDLKRLAGSSLKEGNDGFVLFDAALGYRLQNRRGILSLEGRNLSDENFFYRSYNFQVNEMITSSRFIPTRTFFVRLTLNF
ncbi:TonB-dependent receptor [Nitrosomonas sp. Is79A3]|uniref:TonB-dependent receptor domain-containing protein n=1 Tax=Nitrosomonas sp. (strain Is79A3) TaxID=261292 RepID=UPI000215D172